MKYLHYYDTKTAHDAVYNGNLYEEPWTAYIEDDKLVIYNKPHDYSKDYLTFEALESGTFTFTIPSYFTPSKIESISYSIDNGNTWVTTERTSSTNTIITTPIINAGNKVLWKGIAILFDYDTGRDEYYSTITSTCDCIIYGNIMSLLYDDNFYNNDILPANYTFARLFSKLTKLKDASKLILPATICRQACYKYLFMNCSSLTSAPELPAATLALECYLNMFNGCTSLNSAPELPATTLALNCYALMFYGCTSLTSAPELPATTLVSRCYANMFNGCRSLNYIKAMFTTTADLIYTINWVSGVASTGTFVKNSAATWNVTGVHGIPTGWTVETASA